MGYHGDTINTINETGLAKQVATEDSGKNTIKKLT